MEGAKGRGFKTIFSIVVGAALLATGIGGALSAAALPGTGASLGLSFGMGVSSGVLGLSYGTITLLGAGFLLGGINMLLTPTPKTDTASRKPTSFSFDGPANVNDEGGAIPIVLGEIITGSVTIASSVISTKASGTAIGGIGGLKGLLAAGSGNSTSMSGVMTGNDPSGTGFGTGTTGGIDVGGSGGGLGAFSFAYRAVSSV